MTETGSLPAEAATDTGAPPPTPYPQHWEADVLVADGGVVHLRPSGPADSDQIRAMHGRMSARSLYLRYFSVVNEVTANQVALFTGCLLYTSPSPRDGLLSRMPSSA